MGIARSIARGFGGERKATDVSALTWAALMGQAPSRSGVSVTVDSALKVSTVLACLRVLANGIAQVPLRLMREKADGTKEIAVDHAVHKMLSRRPNAWMTSFEFRQTMMLHAGLTGDGIAYIGRVRGEPRELIPFVPGTVRVERGADWSPVYHHTDASGRATTYEKKDIFHLRGPSWTGLAGLDALQTAREAIGLAIATEETHARLHANGAQPGGILALKSKMTDPVMERLKTQFNEFHGGMSNRFKTLVLDMDASWSPMGMKGVDAQHLETRRFQIEEICRDLGVFPQMVGYSDKTATFASAEAFFLAHVIHTLQPWVTNWEQALARDLFPDSDDLSARFSMQGLLRGDNKARAEFYASGIVNGWLVRNEARRLEDLDPLPGLDEPLTPLNMTTAGDQAALATDVVAAVKSMLGVDGGGIDLRAMEIKVGRVLSATNERRISEARDALNDVLSSLPAAESDGKSRDDRLVDAIRAIAPPTVNVAPAAITVEAPIVNVTTPEIRIVPPNIEITTPPVTVTVEGTKRAATRKTVESYDADGRIKSIREDEIEE